MLTPLRSTDDRGAASPDLPPSARPIVRLVIPSELTRLDDGRWRGTYPSTDIEVTGASRDEVVQQLGRELTALRETAAFARVFDDAMRGVAVPQGWIREEITREQYEHRLRETFGA